MPPVCTLSGGPKDDVTADSHDVAAGRESYARKKCADVVDLDLNAKEKFRWFPACPTVDPC